MKKPELQEVESYLIDSKNYSANDAKDFAETFWNFYESKGWKVGKKPMVKWTAAIVTW